jgi:hypothetical protein
VRDVRINTAYSNALDEINYWVGIDLTGHQFREILEANGIYVFRDTEHFCKVKERWQPNYGDLANAP